jgi:hypothetical protein
VFNALNSLELKSLEEPLYLFGQFFKNPIACLTLGEITHSFYHVDFAYSIQIRFWFALIEGLSCVYLVLVRRTLFFGFDIYPCCLLQHITCHKMRVTLPESTLRILNCFHTLMLRSVRVFIVIVVYCQIPR